MARNRWWVAVAMAALLGSLETATAREEPDRETWVNLIGERPTLEHLKGRAVLLHFFGPPRKEGGGRRGGQGEEGLAQSYVSLVRKFHHDFAGKGLVVLGVCDQGPGKLAEYLGAYDIPYPVSCGDHLRARFGVEGPNELILLDRRGEVYWRGPCNGLWDGKLAKGVKGAQRLGERGVLVLHVERALGKRMRKAAAQCATGELAKALKTIDGALANDRLPPEEHAEAQGMREAVAAHVGGLMEQIEVGLARREVLPAVKALDVLCAELGKHELGAAPVARREEVRADEKLQEELAAAEKYAALVDSVFKRGLGKTRKRIEKLVADHPDTRAAEKARNLLAGR